MISIDSRERIRKSFERVSLEGDEIGSFVGSQEND